MSRSPLTAALLLTLYLSPAPALAGVDCNDNGVPDDCDIASGTSDDCSHGRFDPRIDGVNSDSDGICDVGDCDPVDPDFWFEPEAVITLVLDESDGAALISWQPPAEVGATLGRYDTLRAIGASGFGPSAVCVDSDSNATDSADLELPADEDIFYYLVRVENDCPGSTGALGADSDGAPRTARNCP